jgi:hypothetical protein
MTVGNRFAFFLASSLRQAKTCIKPARDGIFVTEKDTPEIALRIRIKSLPIPGEFDEFDLRPYRIGGTYELPLRLASLLILGGYAERAGSAHLAEAADFGRPTFPPRDRKR